MTDYPPPSGEAGFKAQYANLVRKLSARRLESTRKASDRWLIIRRPGVWANVHVTHWIEPGNVDLRLFGANHDLVGDAVPEGALVESIPLTRIFRWSVPVASWALHPAEQPSVEQAIARAIWCFDWVREHRRR